MEEMTTPTEPVKRVLIVEDDYFICDVYERKFTDRGYAVTVAGDGEVALAKLEEAGDVLPDVILLDIVMPVMDGVETLRKIKADERWKSIPVVMLTNLSDQSDIKEALELGAKDYVIKSHFVPAEVVEKAEAFIR